MKKRQMTLSIWIALCMVLSLFSWITNSQPSEAAADPFFSHLQVYLHTKKGSPASASAPSATNLWLTISWDSYAAGNQTWTNTNIGIEGEVRFPNGDLYYSLNADNDKESIPIANESCKSVSLTSKRISKDPSFAPEASQNLPVGSYSYSIRLRIETTKVYSDEYNGALLVFEDNMSVTELSPNIYLTDGSVDTTLTTPNSVSSVEAEWFLANEFGNPGSSVSTGGSKSLQPAGSAGGKKTWISTLDLDEAYVDKYIYCKFTTNTGTVISTIPRQLKRSAEAPTPTPTTTPSANPTVPPTSDPTQTTTPSTTPSGSPTVTPTNTPLPTTPSIGDATVNINKVSYSPKGNKVSVKFTTSGNRINTNGAILQRAKSKNGPYSDIFMIWVGGSDTYSDMTATPNKTYYYRLIVKSDMVNPEVVSNIKSVKTTITPKIKTFSVKKKGRKVIIKYKWSHGSKHITYYRAGSGKWKKLGTRGIEASPIKIGVSGHGKYSFRIRCYYSYKGKKYYSSYTKSKSVKM